MKITQIRTGNFVDFETIPYSVDTITVDGRLVLVAVNHKWKPEPAGFNEVKGIPVDDHWLADNSFKQHEFLKQYWIRNLDNRRKLIYNMKTRRLQFYRNFRFLGSTPWKVCFVHQIQNACDDIKWEITFHV